MIYFSKKERLSSNFYQSHQTYRVKLQVKIKNLSNNFNNFIFVLPIPSDTHCQFLQGNPAFSLKPDEIGIDEKFNNKYGIWCLGLKVKEETMISEDFDIYVAPQIKKDFNDYLIDEYRKNEEYELYTSTDNYINPKDTRIKNIIDTFGQNNNIFTILNTINKYIIKELEYGEPILGLYKYSDGLEKKNVDCGGFSTLFASLSRACGIPSRIVLGFWAGYKKNEMHAWVEIKLPSGEWISIDPSVEKLRKEGRTKKFGGLGRTGSDRIVFSKGEDISITVKGKKYNIDILQNPFILDRINEYPLQIEADLITKIL